MNNLTTRRLLTAFALALAIPAFSAETSKDTYKIDAVHSAVGFRIHHFIAISSGRFTKFEGTIVVDTKDITKSSVDVTIDAPSIATDNDARDKHLKGADFFDVEKYPTLTFKSTSVRAVPRQKGKLRVKGTFTLHGISKEITLDVSNNGTAPGMKPGTVVAGFEGKVRIKRSDFGMKTYLPPLGPVGDNVEITLNLEAGKI